MVGIELFLFCEGAGRKRGREWFTLPVRNQPEENYLSTNAKNNKNIALELPIAGK